MSHILIIGSNNWADEISLDFFAAMTKEAWETLKKDTKKAFEECGSMQFYIGTNEDINLSSYNDWLDQFKVKTITEEQFNVLKKLFGSNIRGFGAGDNLIHGPSEHASDVEDEDEDDEDDEESDE